MIFSISGAPGMADWAACAGWMPCGIMVGLSGRCVAGALFGGTGPGRNKPAFK